MPFDMELPTDVKAYMLGEVEDNTLLFYKDEKIQAQKPYVIVSTKDMTFDATTETLVPVTPKSMSSVSVDNFEMLGTLNTITEESVKTQGLYILSDAATWNKVTEVGRSKQMLSPYHAFIKASNTDMPNTMQMRLIDDIPVSIEDVTVEKEEKIIYDIYGRRVYELQKGNFYIVNGKKVIFK